jgi:hypothetical protein
MMNNCHWKNTIFRTWAAFCVSTLVSALPAGCYTSIAGHHDAEPQDGTDEHNQDVADGQDVPFDIDSDSTCRTITPTVVWVDFDSSGCFSPEPHVTATILEVSPYCGTPVTWSNDYEWIDETTVIITPSLYMCSPDWQYCDPGSVNTAYLDIPVPASGVTYTAMVGSTTYSFTCSETECPWTDAYITSVFPADDRTYMLWGTTEDIIYDVSYTTGACGCSTFAPLVMTHSDAMDGNYYYGTLAAQICYEHCCWTCDCIDEGWSEQLIRNPGIPTTYESIFEGLYKDIRGFVIDPMASPLSGCAVSLATITAVTTSQPSYAVSDPVDMSVTVRFDSTAASCCETHSLVAFDLFSSSNEIYLFAFKGDCTACTDDSCPPSEVKSFRISPNALDVGEYRVFDSATRTFLYQFNMM